jgi:hypothetical protein
MDYKEYIISEFVNDKGQWQARIRREDGKHMMVNGAAVRVFTTQHASDENEAIRIAKGAIDSKKITVAED